MDPCEVCSSYAKRLKNIKIIMRELTGEAHTVARSIGLEEKTKWHAHVKASPRCVNRILDDYFGSM